MPDLSADAYSAIATASAALIALGIAVVDYRSRRRDQQDAEMAQARLIHAVHSGPYLTLFNDSREPVYDARFVRIRRDSEDLKIGVPAEDCERLLPADEFSTSVTFGRWDVGGDGTVVRAQRRDVVSGAVQFMDASGLFWERDLGDRETPPRRVLGSRRAGPRMERVHTRRGL